MGGETPHDIIMNSYTNLFQLDNLVADLRYIQQRILTADSDSNNVSIDLLDYQSIHEMLDSSTMSAIRQMVLTDLQRQHEACKLAIIALLE